MILKYRLFVPSLSQGAYPDATSYTLMNEASIADLNTRLEEPVTPQHFRPNFVVKGAEVLEEDKWDWVKIGHVVFRNVKPCTRCIFTTVDPDSGVKNAKVEPLKTLKRFVLILTFYFSFFFSLSFEKNWKSISFFFQTLLLQVQTNRGPRA